MEQSSPMNNINNTPVSKHALICKICQLQVDDDTNTFVRCQYCEILLHVSCISSFNNSKKKYFISMNEWSCNECFHLNIIDDINIIGADDVEASSCSVEGEGSSELLMECNSDDILANLVNDDNELPLNAKSLHYEAKNLSLAQHEGTMSHEYCDFIENKITKIRYISFLKGTLTGKPKVFDSFGHGYCLSSMHENYIKWQCIKNNGRDKCHVMLKQIDGNFEQTHEHNHGAIADDYSNALKKKAIEQSPIVLTFSILNNNKNDTPNDYNIKEKEVVRPGKQLKSCIIVANKKSLVTKIKKNKQSSNSKSAYIVIGCEAGNEELKLFDQTKGFTYRLLKITDRSKIWICSSPGGYNKCGATVKQLGNHFIRMQSKHFHRVKKREIADVEKTVNCNKKKKQCSKMGINKNKFIVSKKTHMLSCDNKGQKIRTSRRIRQSLKKSTISLKRSSKAKQVDRIISKSYDFCDETVKEKMSVHSFNRFPLNENIIPDKSKWTDDEKKSYFEVGSVVGESETMDSVVDTGEELNSNPLSREHYLAITKIFLDIMNTGFPVNPNIKFKTSNLKNNKLFKIFIDGCQCYFDKYKLNIFPKCANKPSPLWIMQFLQKSTLLSERLTDLASKSYSATSWSKVSWFYTNLERSLKETYRQDPHHYLDVNNDYQIFNCDSLVLTINLKNFDEKIHKQSQKTMTVLCCVSSSGQSIKPLIINRGKSIAKYVSDYDIDSKYNSICSINGKVDSQIFHEWLLLFDNQLVELGIQKPVLLFLNGIHTYVTYKSIQFAANKKIAFYNIPPNSSGALSPLSVSVFPVLKVSFYKKFKNVLIRNKFPLAFIRTYEDINVTELAVEGFKKSGLCPYNETACNNKFIEKDIPAGEYKNLRTAKEPVLSLFDSSCKTKNSSMSNNSFTTNILKGVSQSNLNLDKLNDKLQGACYDKLNVIGSFEHNHHSEIKKLNAKHTKLSKILGTNTLLSNGSPLLTKSHGEVDITNEMAKTKAGTLSELVKDFPSTVPNDRVDLENIINENLSLNTSIDDSLTPNRNSEIYRDEPDFGIINNDSVMDKKLCDIVSLSKNLESSCESFAATNNINQILSNSGKIGYQIALENMEEVFRNVIDPDILSLYDKKLALDEDYPDTTYLAWCGLQHLKKMIAAQVIS